MFLPDLFKNYLKTQKISPVTRKNYLADINNFFTWLNKKTGIKYQVAGKAILGLFTKETINEYKEDQIKEKTPLSTINRRFSTLRKFGSFIQSQGWLHNNPALEVSNLDKEAIKTPLGQAQKEKEILINFKENLVEENISPITIKNYLSDLRHFLGWLKEA